jgi:predicted dinucleotide-binding enzyme
MSTRAARAQATGAKLKIATIGAGREGGALGTLFAKEGHTVMFSSRNPDSLKDLVASAGPNAKAGTVAQAVAFADVVLIAVPYTAMEQIAKDYGPALATKQLVFDVSNPIPRRDGEDFVKKINDQGGAGVASAKMLPGAHVVRAFNAIGSGGLTAASQGRAVGRADHRRRREGDRAGKRPDQGTRLRAGAHRRLGEGQVPGARHAAGGRTHAGRDPQDRRGPVVTGIAGRFGSRRI